jgi:GTPase SAR1 family protein
VAVSGIELIDRAIELAKLCDRPEVLRRVQLVRERMRAPGVRVLVVGEPKKGKSSLVNALVGAPVCAVGDDATTVTPTLVRHAAQPGATLVMAAADADTGVEPERIAVPLEGLAPRVAAEEGRQDGRRLLHVEVALPRRLLEGGLELVDTAGVGGMGGLRSLATLDLLPRADAVVFVSDASQEFTGPEMALLKQAAALCPTVVCVLTKIDTAGQWRTIAELDRAHLVRQGLDAPLFPVASPLAVLAVQHKDRELHEESGIEPLAGHLRRAVLERGAALAGRAFVHDLTSVTSQLALGLRSELAGLEDPARNESLMQELEAARTAVDQLRRRSARWQQVLNDGVTDLMADIDYDLRDRSRAVIREAEEAIDAQDPGPMWPELSEWLDQRIGIAVGDSFVWAEQRSEFLAERVMEQFERDGGMTVPELSIGDAAEALGGVVEMPDLDSGQLRLRERLLIGMRGSYSGLLMTGLVTSLAGMAVINPISVAAGVLIGRKAYRDDRANRLQRRRNEAKNLVRRHLDEVVFQVGKQLKDRLRTVQRTLRDLLNDTVEEMFDALGEAQRAVQRSTKEATAERDARLRVLRSRLSQVERLAADVGKLTAPAVPV